MKSIEEKSKEHGLQYPVIHYDADGNIYYDVDKPSIDFEAGANYVLEEIEKLVKFNRWAAQDLYELIEQLKK